MQNRKSRFCVMTFIGMITATVCPAVSMAWAEAQQRKTEPVYQCAVINKPVHEKNLSAKDVRSLKRTFDQAKAKGAIESIEIGTVADNDEKAVVIVKVSEPQ